MEASLTSIQSTGHTVIQAPQKSHLFSLMLIMINHESRVVQLKSMPVIVFAQVICDYKREKKPRIDCQGKEIQNKDRISNRS